MGLANAFNRPYINPFYHSQDDEEPDDVVRHEIEVAEGRPSGLPPHSSSGSGDNQTPPEYDEKDGHIKAAAEVSSLGDSVDSRFQAGVQKAEAVTIVWSKKALWGTYAWIYVVYFILALMSTVTSYLGTYAYADFASSPLVSISSVMSSIIGGVLRLPTAKIIDIWGRAEGFMLMIVICTIGLIIYASCTNVSGYTAGAVLYYIGYDGMYYVLTVFIADTTKLKNRVLMLAISQTPFVCTAFTTPYIVSSFVTGAGWRWGYGTFAIVMPVACVPLSLIFLYFQRKAEKQGLIKKVQSGRTASQTIVYYLIEFDIIGCIILIAGFVLFLLPFSLATSQSNQWKSAKIIVMLVIGFVLLCVFPVWEGFLGPKVLGSRFKQFLPWWMLKDRTVFGAVLCICSLYMAFYCWDLYYYTFCQVVLNMNITNATYMGEIYTVGSCFFCVISGALVSWTKRYKWVAFCCVPIYMLGTGLMIYFRQPGVNYRYVIMCQIFIAFAGGTLVPTHQVAALAAGTHGEFATVLALLYMSSSVGGAIGDSIAGGIWTNVYPTQLAKLLPADVKSQASAIYANYLLALNYPQGSPARTAIEKAFGIAQKDMCIAATSITAFTFIAVWIWRDINLANKKQVKGTVV